MFPVDLITPLSRLSFLSAHSLGKGYLAKNSPMKPPDKQNKGEISIGLDKNAVFYKISFDKESKPTTCNSCRLINQPHSFQYANH
jgi:hypothetical protein